MKEKRTGLVIEFFLPLNGTQNRRTEIRTETTQDDVKQDRNGQNKRGGHISERPEPDMNKKRRTGSVNTYTIHVDRTQNRSNRKQHKMKRNRTGMVRIKGGVIDPKDRSRT